MEGISSRRWALLSGYWCAGLGGEPLRPEVRWTYGPDYMAELAGGDGCATSVGELPGF